MIKSVKVHRCEMETKGLYITKNQSSPSQQFHVILSTEVRSWWKIAIY
jgi:hypothetical protein